MLDLPTDKVVESDLTDVLWRDASGVDVLLAPPRVEMAEMVVARDIEKTLSLLRRLYDLVIVDTGVGLDELTLAILDQADTILEIVTYDGTTIRNTVSMAETFRKIGYPPSKVHYLLNRSRRDRPASTRRTFARRSGATRSITSGPRARSSDPRATRARLRDRRAERGRQPAT